MDDNIIDHFNLFGDFDHEINCQYDTNFFGQPATNLEGYFFDPKFILYDQEANVSENQQVSYTNLANVQMPEPRYFLIFFCNNIFSVFFSNSRESCSQYFYLRF